ncbi:hypothetical protein F4V43_03335 [Paenibacillus spiritus]|uniref:Polymer-forming cytoskeletal protein n=1 Tax=Paenibacillus spiritus TaxID=2496557 RepID=A0A5J5GHH4_9BACL|nr:hypothetical protein [Paenibacillus spiritus]KAA9007537.1 hypothetical protein F4V43_03335 [Paenibacillus spiritus]
MMNKYALTAGLLGLVLLAGCGNNNNDNGNNSAGSPAPSGSPAASASPSPSAGAGASASPAASADAVTSASVVDNEEAFKHAIGKEGTWIAATLKDLTFTEDLVLEGKFVHKDETIRKIALYTQDADHNITNSFRLTAPKLTIRSENARIQGGTFVGDVYVEANGFSLVNATVEGNVHFAKEEYKKSFSTADQGKVTGQTEVMAH